MVDLYNAPLSTCSIKVRWALAEKGVEASLRWVDLQRGEQFSPEYLALNSGAVVPTLVDGSLVVTESTLINEYIEARFPGASLCPAEAAHSYQMRRLTHMLDHRLHPACIVVTSAVAGRPGQLKLPRQDVLDSLAKIPDPGKRRIRTSVFEEGVDSEFFRPALEQYVSCLDAADACLSGGGFLAGKSVSLADCGVLPYVMRLDHLGLAGLWQEGRRPRLGDWYVRMKERESFRIALEPYLQERVLAALHASGDAVMETMAAVTGLG